MSIKYNSCQLDFEYPAIKQLALSRLKTAADNYFVNSPKQLFYSIAISYRPQDCCQVVYVSNVAFIFSKILNIPPLEIAKDFAAFYTQRDLPPQDFAIAVVPPGVLQFKLTELKLATWLQCLPFLLLTLARLPPPKYSSPLRNNSDLFAVQYAYARCYSLLKLAQREGLIDLEEISAKQIKSEFPDLNAAIQEGSILTIHYSPSFSWLKENQQMQFCHPAEYALIIQLVKVVDEFCLSTQLNLDYWAKTALNLSRTFVDFYSHCRIFGETNAQRPQLAQGRLGLILATSAVLKLLLQHLGVFAPQEL